MEKVLKNSMGVYMIINLKTDKKYYGSSKCIRKRFYEHKGDLRKGTHYNEELQKDWNLYSELYFKFLIVENVEEHSILRERELYYIKSTDNVYNLSFPDNNLGTSKQHESTIIKLRKISLEKEAQDPEKYRLARVRAAETMKRKFESGELKPFGGKSVEKNNPKTSKVILAIKDEITVEYPSIKEAARQLQFKASKIQDVLYGYKWKKYTTKKKGEMRVKINCTQYRGYEFKYKE